MQDNGGLRKPYHIFQVKAIVTDKLLGKLIHGHIAALVLILDELGNVLSHHKILVVSVLGSVLAYTFGKGCVLLVESSEQGLVFGAKLNYESCMAKPKPTQNGED